MFLGANTVICAPVTIGNDSIIAAGAVVTKDIPPYEVWGGTSAVSKEKGHLFSKYRKELA